MIVLGKWHHRVGAAVGGWLRPSAALTNVKSSIYCADDLQCLVLGLILIQFFNLIILYLLIKIPYLMSRI